MKLPGIKLSYLLLAAMFALATACTSSDSSSTAPKVTSITVENMQALAIAGTEGVKQSIKSESASLFAKTTNETPIQELTVSLAQQIAADPQFELIAGICDSGTVDQTFTSSTGSITYNDCEIAGAIYDGSAVFTSSSSGDLSILSITYTNFTVTFDGEVTTLDLQMTCTTNTSTYESDCSYNSEALGIDGRVYTVSDSSVTGDAFSGYTVEATVTDPDNGEVTVSTSSVVILGCANGQPSSGTITVSDGTSSMTVTFIDCTSYSVKFDGATVVFDW